MVAIKTTIMLINEKLEECAYGPKIPTPSHMHIGKVISNDNTPHSIYLFSRLNCNKIGYNTTKNMMM
jgi:hypothetical protein